MKSVLLTTSIIFTYTTQSATEYVSNVPTDLASIYDVAGEPCTSSSDCDDLYAIDNTSLAMWKCENDTTNAGVCIYDGCYAHEDCAIDQNEFCVKMFLCDNNGEFYEEDTMLYSQICLNLNTVCGDIKVEGTWTEDSMCYTGTDDVLFYSEEEANLCGEVCVADEYVCKESEDSCIEDDSCCDNPATQECFEYLLEEYMIWTIAGMVVFVLCCIGCCVGCYCVCCKKKGDQSFDGLETETNHYNVYV